MTSARPPPASAAALRFVLSQQLSHLPAIHSSGVVLENPCVPHRLGLVAGPDIVRSETHAPYQAPCVVEGDIAFVSDHLEERHQAATAAVSCSVMKASTLAS